MSVKPLLKEAFAAIKGGDKERARGFLRQVLAEEEDNESAWLLMSGVADSDAEQLMCLERVLAINPENRAAQQGYAQLQEKMLEAGMAREAEEAAKKLPEPEEPTEVVELPPFDEPEPYYEPPPFESPPPPTAQEKRTEKKAREKKTMKKNESSGRRRILLLAVVLSTLLLCIICLGPRMVAMLTGGDEKQAAPTQPPPPATYTPAAVSPTVTATPTEAPAAAAPTMLPAEALPADVPPYPGAERMPPIPGGDPSSLYFRVDTTVEEVRDFYREQMPLAGWQPGMLVWGDDPAPSMDSASYEKDGREVILIAITNCVDGDTCLVVETR